MGVGGTYPGEAGRGEKSSGMGPIIYAPTVIEDLWPIRNRESLDPAPAPGAKSAVEDAEMARTRDETRWEGYAVAVNGRWDGFLRLAYPSPLDTGAMSQIVNWTLFLSKISPVTATGATEIYPQIAKGEKAGGRDA